MLQCVALCCSVLQSVILQVTTMSLVKKRKKNVPSDARVMACKNWAQFVLFYFSRVLLLPFLFPVLQIRVQSKEMYRLSDFLWVLLVFFPHLLFPVLEMRAR